MYLKLMERAGGDFQVLEVTDCSFHSQPPTVVINKGKPGEASYAIEGPCYLLNDQGKTIQTFNHTARHTS